jgi:RNA polymerase sigma-70 factor (ECF subfamily)
VRAQSEARTHDGFAGGLDRRDLKAASEHVDVGSVATSRAPDIAPAFTELLADARRGVPTACGELYDSTAGQVCGYLRAHGAPEPDDLTSEVFLRVFDRLPQFTGGETQFRSWVFTIVHHLLIDDSRRRKRRPQTTRLDDRPHPAATGDAETEALESMGTEWVNAAVASLPPDQRTVILLRVAADLPIDEVARIVGKRTGAVKALQHRAIASLRRRVPEGLT